MANNKERQAYNYFLSIGYAPHESAGIVGNLIAESGMNTTAHGDKRIVEGGSHGLAQWNGPRIKKLKEMYGKDWTKFENQLAFIDWELKNTHKNAYKALKDSKDIAGATHAITTKYEIPADRENKAKQRTKFSQGIFDKYSGDSNIANQRGTSFHPSLNLVGATPTPNFNTESIFDDGILDMILEEEEAEDLIALEEEEDLYEEEMEEDNEESIAEVEEQADTEQEVEEEKETRDYIQEALNVRAQQVAMIEDMFTYGEEEEGDEYFLQEGGSVGVKSARPRFLGGGEIDTKGFNGEEIEDYRISRDTSSELGRLLEIVLKSNRTPNTLGRLNKKKILNNFS